LKKVICLFVSTDEYMSQVNDDRNAREQYNQIGCAYRVVMIKDESSTKKGNQKEKPKRRANR